MAVITGAGSGIGRATALLFAEEGALVIANVFETGEAGPLEHAAQNLPGRVKPVVGDVSRDDDVSRIIGEARKEFGGMDILFNNAGIESFGTVTETTDDAWQRILDTNLKGVFLCSRRAVPEMLQRGGGAIVNNASINALRGNHRLAAYSASKGGVVGITRAMALDYAAQGIRVNCVCPATVTGTKLLDASLASRERPDDHLAYLLAKHPMGRLGTPQDVAYAVLFLASDESAFITGVALPIDGGRSIR